jgi:hypothetical protein
VPTKRVHSERVEPKRQLAGKEPGEGRPNWLLNMFIVAIFDLEIIFRMEPF